MKNAGADLVLYALEGNASENYHVHVLSDAFMNVHGLRNTWKYGYVEADLPRNPTAVYHYLIKRMTMESDRYRLVIFQQPTIYKRSI